MGDSNDVPPKARKGKAPASNHPEIPIRPEIQLPGPGKSMSEFAHDVGEAISVLIQSKRVPEQKGAQSIIESRDKTDGKPSPSDMEECFLCIRFGVFGRIRKNLTVGRQLYGLYFEPIDNEQAVTELERWIEFVVRDKTGTHPHSMTPSVAKTLIASDHFRRHLPVVDRLFDFAIPVRFQPPRSGASVKPFDVKDDTVADAANDASAKESETEEKSENSKIALRFMRPGFGSYKQKNGEHVFYYCDAKLKHYISVDQAKKVIEALFDDFVFVDEQSRRHAIARLITPSCQALMGWRKRSPLWVFTANKPRAGKDYLAMITPLTHALYPIQDPPLEDESEVKRRITAALSSGRRFMHFANCRNDLDHPSLEAAVTAEYWTDRIIRSSTEATMPNELIFSLSYNGELHITPDLAARIRMIRLKNEKANPNSKQYRNPYLHDFIGSFDPQPNARGAAANTAICRRNILCAIEALIRNWSNNFEKGKRGKRMSSYPEWSDVVGGIMQAADLGDPCATDPTLVGKYYGPRDLDLLNLIQTAAKNYPDQHFSTGEITEKILKSNFSQFPHLRAQFIRLREKKFNVEFGQVLSENSGDVLLSEDLECSIVKVPDLKPNRFKFLTKPIIEPSEEGDGIYSDISNYTI